MSVGSGFQATASWYNTVSDHTVVKTCKYVEQTLNTPPKGLDYVNVLPVSVKLHFTEINGLLCQFSHKGYYYGCIFFVLH